MERVSFSTHRHMNSCFSIFKEALKSMHPLLTTGLTILGLVRLDGLFKELCQELTSLMLMMSADHIIRKFLPQEKILLL